MALVYRIRRLRNETRFFLFFLLLIGFSWIIYLIPEQHSESEYKEKPDSSSISSRYNQHPVDKVHHRDSSLMNFEKIWTLTNSTYKRISFETSHGSRDTVYLTSHYYITRPKSSGYPDITMHNQLEFYPRKFINETHGIYVFKSTPVKERDPEKKDRICKDFDLAFEIPLVDQVYPTPTFNNNLFPTAISKLVHSCNVDIFFRPDCDDLTIKDSERNLIGRMKITNNKHWPVVLTHSMGLLECYSGLKIDE